MKSTLVLSLSVNIIDTVIGIVDEQLSGLLVISVSARIELGINSTVQWAIGSDDAQPSGRIDRTLVAEVVEMTLGIQGTDAGGMARQRDHWGVITPPPPMRSRRQHRTMTQRCRMHHLVIEPRVDLNQWLRQPVVANSAARDSN